VSLRVAVAAPFRHEGSRSVTESEFVVALSLDRDWYSPDQAKRLVDVADGEGLVRRDGDEIVAEFEFESVEIPTDFTPDEALLQERTPFERVLDDLVGAGHEKREAVAAINGLQQDLAVTIEAAAVVYARRHGLDVSGVADGALEDLRSPTED